MQIDNVELATMAVRTSQYPEDKLPEFLLVGRSNVGKSSFINTLINRKNFAHTSSKPGKTQTLNFYNINNTSSVNALTTNSGYLVQSGNDYMLPYYTSKTNNVSGSYGSGILYYLQN